MSLERLRTSGDGDATRWFARLRAGLRSVVAALADRESALWGVALAALVGDLVLTYHGLERGLTEANPVARAAVEASGFAGLAALKGMAVAVGLAGWHVLPERAQAVVPLALALPWSLAVVVNLLTLAAL